MKLSVDPTHRKIVLTHGVETVRLEPSAAWRIAVDILAAVNDLDNGGLKKRDVSRAEEPEGVESAG
jgi:hypothetical protein